MIIIDASVVHKWFNEEENSDQALKILALHLKQKAVIVAPDLILYELSNIWATKTTLTAKEASNNLKLLEKHSLKFIQVNFHLVQKAISFSKKYQISVYDASYAVLAKEKKCNLITADEKFINQVNLKFVKSLKDC